MKNQPEVQKKWNVLHSVEEGKFFIIFSPAVSSEGYEPMKMEVTKEQLMELQALAKAPVPFLLSRQIKEGVNHLSFMAAPVNINVDYNFKIIAITIDQWDTLRFSCMQAINDRTGVTDLCYL